MKTLYSIILSFLILAVSAKDRSRNDSTTPTMTEKAISAGFNHTLIIQEGEVWAWGEGIYGQLGNGGFDPFGVEAQVVNLDHIIAVSAGKRHSMALRADGVVFVWGDNTYGQLGTSPSPAVPVPVQVPLLTDVIDIQAGDFHCLALKSDGTVISWGANANGELGQGTTSTFAGPANVLDPSGSSNLSGITLISAGARHSLAILDGEVLAWGDNSNTQLGLYPSTTNSSIPIFIQTGKFFRTINLNNIISLSAGETHSMAIDVEGQLWTWGEGVYGQLGIGTVDPMNPATYRRRTAKNVASKVRTMAAGATHSMYIDSRGELHFFGTNYLGQLGIPVTTPRVLSDSTIGLNKMVALACGNDFTVVLKADGTIHGAGDAAHAQIGTPTYAPFYDTLNHFYTKTGRIAQVANQDNSYVLKADGTVWSFGHKDYLGFYSSSDVSTPTQIPALSNIIAIGGTNSSGLALDVEGKVWSWGENISGVCGQGDTISLHTLPDTIPGLHDVVYVDGTIQGYISLDGGSSACALKVTGELYTWGNNFNYMLGDGSTIKRLSPVSSTITSKDFSISMSRGNTFVLNADNSVDVWGEWKHDGSTLSSGTYNVIRQINTTSKVKSISTTRDIRMALIVDGTMEVWGLSDKFDNPDFFQICKGSSPFYTCTYPSKVYVSPTSSTLIDNIKFIESGDDVAFFITANGNTLGWGENKYGQLGLGYISASEFIPAPISCTATGYGVSMYSSLSFEHHSLANEVEKEIVSWGATNHHATSVIHDPKIGYTLACNSALRIAFFEDSPEEIILSVYPNPATTEINIAFGEESGEFEYQLLDASGRRIRSGKSSKGESIIQTTNLLPGLYFIEVNTGEYSETKRVVIQ